MDGHWVLASALQNPKGLDTSLQTFTSRGGKVVFDKSVATIDISGTKITGGTYKTGFFQTTGDPCSVLASNVDLIPSGGVDQTVGYGQLILDGRSAATFQRG